MELIVWTTFTFAGVAVSTLLRAVVLQSLWGWFIQHKFGLPALDLTEAIGLSLVVGFLTNTYVYDERPPKETIVMGLCVSLFYSAMVWVIGWVVYSI